MRRESAMLIADIKNNEPTVLLVDNFSDNWSKWLAEVSPGRNHQRHRDSKQSALSGIHPAAEPCRHVAQILPKQILPKTVAMHLVSQPE